MKFLFLFLMFPLLAQAQTLPGDSVINIASLRNTVNYLSADSLRGRLTGSAGALSAADYIATRYAAIGLITQSNKSGYFDSFPAYHQKKVTGVNIVGLLPAEIPNDSFVIFSAHYDHIGVGRDLALNKDFRSDDDIYNGANDNASGVAALLELAQYYSNLAGRRYNLLFIAFAGEELGMVGSSAYVKKTYLKVIKAMINLEMLGRPGTGGCYIISFGNRKLKNQLNENLKRSTGEEKDFFRSDPYYGEELVYRSDHYPFTRKVKNAFTIMATSPTDEFYHTVDDEYETIDFDFLLTATRKIALACELFIK